MNESRAQEGFWRKMEDAAGRLLLVGPGEALRIKTPGCGTGEAETFVYMFGM